MFLNSLKFREVTVFKRKNIRGFVGGVLGLAAGMSLTTTIIPTAVATVVGGEPFFVRFALAEYFAHTALVWGAAAWAAARIGSSRLGAVILGATGAVTGLLLALAALGSTAAVLLSASIGSLVYGIIGGLIISGIMPGDDERLMIDFDRKKSEENN
ncbi:hypothetical protein [Trichlorobacter ammonificans]|uniref:Uncharacterized protein n=1 Tax=Trichlorobacter ammonificans TaxID=2916410 RepID=A0ABN8HDJ8_9BACT|nr:hypothetical protein [Trichlorobacter ammonificans]CAH2030885.1 membrane protein of unknown function [Trichlorobacter ammonificans]